jgi:hypothetical protein
VVGIESAAVSPAGWWGCGGGVRFGTAKSENSISRCFVRISSGLASLPVLLGIGSQPGPLRSCSLLARPPWYAVAVVRAKLCHIDYTAVPIDQRYDSVSFALLRVVAEEYWQGMRDKSIEGHKLRVFLSPLMRLARCADGPDS